MKRFYLGAALALLGPVHAGAYQEFCDDPGFVMRANAPLPEESLEPLLSPRERAEPGAVERLFLAPGPYGHNELGFRYLARAFGYDGRNYDRHEVEAWLARRELEDPEFRGTWELWVRWVREPGVVLRSRVKPGVARISSYFRDPLDATAYGACVSSELARLRCENYLGKKLRPGARVYYAQKDSNRQPCRVHYNGGDLSEEVPDRLELPVSQYYKKASRGTESPVVKAEGTKTIDFKTSFTGKPGGDGGAQPAK